MQEETLGTCPEWFTNEIRKVEGREGLCHLLILLYLCAHTLGVRLERSFIGVNYLVESIGYTLCLTEVAIPYISEDCRKASRPRALSWTMLFYSHALRSTSAEAP